MPLSRERLVLLAVLLLAFAALKASFNPGLGRNEADAHYYLGIARHVAAGDGLKTGVSLYHQGLKSFPHPTNVSPLWPLALGGAAVVLGLSRAAWVLPEVLFLADLALLYFLVNAVVARLGGPRAPLLVRRGACLDAGHAAVALFATNPVLFHFSSLPYTEPLALALLFGSLLATVGAADHAARGRGGLAWGALAGVLAAAAFLTRAQMAGVVLAVPLALALAARGDRRLLRPAGAAAGAGLLTVAPWIAYLATWVRPLRPAVLFVLGAYRETPELPPFRLGVATESIAGFLADRAGGLVAAFFPGHPASYLESFGPAALLVPLALLRLAAGFRDLGARLGRLASPAGAGAVAALSAGVLVLAPVHLTHARFFKDWLFGYRHGLPLILLLALALSCLDGLGGRWLRGTAFLLVGASLASGTAAVGRLLADPPARGLRPAERELVAWLDGQSPRPAVATTNAQTLAAFSRGGFHWLECGGGPEQTRALLRHAGADYVLATTDDEICSFLAGLDRELELVREFAGSSFSVRVFRLAPR